MAKVPAAFNFPVLEQSFDYKYNERELFIKRMNSISTFQEITDIIKFFLDIFVVSIDIYLIIIVCRNPKLKMIKANKLIMHFSLFNILYTISKPILTIFMEIFDLWQHITLSFWCIQDEIENSGLLGMFLTGLALSVNWLITVNCKNVKQIFLKLNNNLIIVIYVLISANLIGGFILCQITYRNWSLLPQLIFLLLTIIFVIICDCKIKADDNKKNYPLRIANVVIMSWIPIILYLVLHAIFQNNYTVLFILYVTLFIPEFIAYGSPITVIFTLYYINKNFKIAVRKSCCTNNGYGLENHFEDEGDESCTDDLENKAQLL
ncbi:uncharacterized protein LOC130449041 [Diorhabda sublineata]|uniref:uncharacterized protein LOC130449041 n=1 Tax=Diorhabda sublineata TaxID=1163346 RepID=UPI0024E17623|nr:uncharacterized protein LOC130449041 [Diorhabda sublineata]